VCSDTPFDIRDEAVDLSKEAGRLVLKVGVKTMLHCNERETLGIDSGAARIMHHGR
jgi:hypothetical protein